MPEMGTELGNPRPEPWPLRVLSPLKARTDTLGDTRTTDERFEQFERNLAAIAAHLHGRATACRILVVDYLSVLPQTARPPTAAADGHHPARDHHTRGR